MVENNAEAKVPSEIADFVGLLKDHEVKEAKALAIGKFISRTGSAEVFERPRELADFLARYPRDLAPVQRRRILEQWFAEKGISVPEELLIKTSLHPKDVDKAQKEEELRKKKEAGKVWTVGVDDRGIPSVRMIKDASEPGTTLEEAKSAAKEIGKDYAGDEALVAYNESLHRHMPNFKSDFVKQHPGAAWAVARQMDQAMAAGEPIDPMDAFVDQMAKLESMRELVGGGRKEPEARGSTMAEAISAVKELRDMASEGKELPSWMSDPVVFQKTIQELTPKGDTEALKELRDEMTKLREDHYQAELKRKDEQNAELVSVIQGYRGEVSKLRDEIEKNKVATGRTAYDLLGDLVQKVPNREDVRAMVMEAVGKGPKLLPRGTGERAQVLEGMATGIEHAAELKSIEDWWFKLG